MEYADIVTQFGSMGGLMVICVLLLRYMSQTMQTYSAALNSLRDVIAANTAAIEALRVEISHAGAN